MFFWDSGLLTKFNIGLIYNNFQPLTDIHVCVWLDDKKRHYNFKFKTSYSKSL